MTWGKARARAHMHNPCRLSCNWLQVTGTYPKHIHLPTQCREVSKKKAIFSAFTPISRHQEKNSNSQMHTDDQRKLLSCLWCYLLDSCSFHEETQRRTWTQAAGAHVWRKEINARHLDSLTANVNTSDLLTKILVASECLFGKCNTGKYFFLKAPST